MMISGGITNDGLSESTLYPCTVCSLKVGCECEGSIQGGSGAGRKAM